MIDILRYIEGVCWLLPLKSYEAHDISCDISLHFPVAIVVWMHVRTLGGIRLHSDISVVRERVCYVV